MEQVGQFYDGINWQCEIHKKSRLIFASLIASDQNPFYCSTCAVKRQKETIPFVSIQDILTSDQETQPIQNWPPGIHEDDIHFLQNIQTDLIKDKLRQGILDFHENLSKQIYSAINESQKEQLNKLDIHFGSENLIDLYNKQFQRKELVRIFENFGAQSKDEYMKLLTQLNITSKKYLEILQQSITEKKGQVIRFREFQDNSIKALSEQFTSILNDLSSSLFKPNDEGVTEKYDFKMDNSSSDEEIENESTSQESQESQDSELYSLEDKQLLLYSKQHFEIDHSSKFITSVKNTFQKEGYCIDLQSFNKTSKLSFKIKFFNHISFENFAFCFLRIDKISLADKVMFRDFWKRVIRITNESMNEDNDDDNDDDNVRDDLIFSFFMNTRQRMLRLESSYFEDGLIQRYKFNYLSNNYRILFYLSKDCEGFEISEFSCSN